MSAIPIITQLLLANEDVTDIVGDKIFPIMAPQNTERPYIVLHLVDTEDAEYLYGAARYYRSLVQVDSYTEQTPEGAAQVMRLGDAVIEALNGVVKAKVAGSVDIDVLLGDTDFTESFLEAQTHRRYTRFTCRWRKQPGKPAEGPDESPVIDEWSFAISAASNDGAGGTAVGYSGAVNFQSRPSFGALSAERLSGFALQACYRIGAPSNNSIIAFTGDVSALLAGKHVWVDGVDYGPGDQYKFTYISGVTIWNRITGGPGLVAGETYDIEIKAPA